MKRRGSALVYVIIVVFSITSVVVVSAKLSSASENEFQTAYREAQFKTMSDGVVAETVSDSYRQVASIGNKNTTFTLGNLTTNVAEHPTMKRAYVLNISGTLADRSYATKRVIGKRERAHPAYYGLWVNSNYSDSLLGTTVNGSAYFAGSALLSGVWNITEDFLVRGSSTISLGTTVGGSYLTGVRAQTMPTFAAGTYSPQSTTIATNTQADITFAGLDAQGKYPSRVRTGNFSLSGGTLSGKGTVVVDGNLNVNGNYNYSSADSRVVFLVTGNMNINLLCSQLAGTYIVLGRISVSSLAVDVTRGNICTNGQLQRLTAALTITQDDTFLEQHDERVKHRLPGFFP